MRKHRVVVVGGGPAGLTAAVALGRAGVDVLLLERRSAGSALPRATVLSLRTMELMRAWGLEALTLAGADAVEMTMLEMPTAARAGDGVVIDVGYPTVAQSAVLSPTGAACVAQDHLESVLLEYLGTLRSVTVERGLEVVGVTTTGRGAIVTARDAAGRPHHVTAAYVVGADGARSVVRTALGIELVGPDDVLNSMSVEFRARLWDVLGDHRHLLYVTTATDARGVLLPAGQTDRWLFSPHYEEGAEPASEPDTDDLREHIRRASGVPDLEVRIERMGRFSSAAQLATRFSCDAVYLIGDAAHRVTPRGGTGLNIAIADGFDLGWKLGWVLRRWAPTSLLATYELERRPLVAHNVERSSDPLGSRRSAATEVPVDVSGRIRHVWLDPFRVSSLDRIGDALTLFVGGSSSPWEDVTRAVRSPVPISIAALDPMVARSVGINPGGALLVRPDGVPVASWSSSDDAVSNLGRAVATVSFRGTPDVLVEPGSAA